jgi:Na+/proline symporter
MAQPLHVRDIIDQAIHENRWNEWLLYVFAVVFVALGVTIVIWSLIVDSVLAWAGVAESVLFVPAAVLAMRIRHQNTALRMIEVPLRKAKSAEEAAQVLIHFFGTAFGVGTTPGTGVRGPGQEDER